MNYKPLIISLYEIGAIKFGDFTLKSGLVSKFYFDLRKIVSYPDVLKAVAEAIWHQMSGYRFDMICGVPYTALPIATCVSLQQSIPMVLRRKEKKDHGTRQMIEGEYKTGQICLVIEDLVTTGSSVIETADELEIVGLQVKDIAVLIDRQQGGQENLQARHYRLHAAITMKEIFTVLLHAEEVSETDRQIINGLLQESGPQ